MTTTLKRDAVVCADSHCYVEFRASNMSAATAAPTKPRLGA